MFPNRAWFTLTGILAVVEVFIFTVSWGVCYFGKCPLKSSLQTFQILVGRPHPSVSVIHSPHPYRAVLVQVIWFRWCVVIGLSLGDYCGLFLWGCLLVLRVGLSRGTVAAL